MTNKSLYRMCQEKPLSLQIKLSRWSLWSHILRKDKDIPANKVTRAYFIPNGNKLRGRPKTTLPLLQIVFNRDLALIHHQIRVHSSKDLVEITELAQDRKCWRGLISQIKKAAEVSRTWNDNKPVSHYRYIVHIISGLHGNASPLENPKQLSWE